MDLLSRGCNPLLALDPRFNYKGCGGGGGGKGFNIDGEVGEGALLEG